MVDVYNGNVRLVLFDVDGVLTDGSIYVGPSGEEFKKFNVKDGPAIALLRRHGIYTGVISGKSSEALDFRLNQLGFDYFVTGCSEKLPAYVRIRDELKFSDDQIVFVGDDIVDLPVIDAVGISYAPADAHALVLEAAHHLTKSCGGQGVAREVAEHILISGGLDLNTMYFSLLENREKPFDVQQ